MKKATRQHTKKHNRNLVLRTIFACNSVSRAEMARVTHLTRTTVSEIVSGLLEEGLVEEVGIGESIGGKVPHPAQCGGGLPLYDRFEPCPG